jgi:2-C-methyl-D-erythritol 4-phosphate cytidylyltransferase
VTVWTIVVAAGEGRRFGGLKQFEVIDGHSVLEWAVMSARAASDGIVLVVPPALAGDAVFAPLADHVVAGGAHRSASVRAGLSAVPLDADVVVVHDAARPAASVELFKSVIGAVRNGADGAIPAIAITDTVKRVASDGRVLETLDRRELYSAQTPQAFRAEVLRRAHREEGEATDDAGLLERVGADVVIVEGERSNVKLTEFADLEHLRVTLHERGEAR